MWRFRKRDRDELDLERELRANRPEPSADFVTSLAAEIRGSGAPAPARRVRASRRPAFRLRLAPALGFTILCLVAAGAFGGAIATGGGKHSDDKGEHHDGKGDDHNGKGDDDDADEDQYDKKVVICHHPNGNDPHTIRVSKKAAAKHIANHGDTLGPRPDNGGGKGDDDDDDDNGNAKDDDDKGKGKNGKGDDD